MSTTPIFRRSRVAVAGGVLLAACRSAPAADERPSPTPATVQKAPALTLPARLAVLEPLRKSAEEWRRLLAPETYRVMWEQGTERAFTGALWNKHEPGTYRCASCGLVLFTSGDKYDSGSGWPSFTRPVAQTFVETRTDVSHGMARHELLCARCRGHLGHVFDDGPAPTGMRYCVNSAALAFEPEAGK